MTYLIITALLLILPVGFLILTQYETAHGVRFFASRRSKLDRAIARIQFIFSHVDLAAFLRDEVRRLAERAGHDIVHLSLQLVRAVERELTRLVRTLRARQAALEEPLGNTRTFVKTLTDFKMHLKAHPKVSEIR